MWEVTIKTGGEKEVFDVDKPTADGLVSQAKAVKSIIVFQDIHGSYVILNLFRSDIGVIKEK